MSAGTQALNDYVENWRGFNVGLTHNNTFKGHNMKTVVDWGAG